MLSPYRSHILFELLKNSLRAVVERFRPETEPSSLPPIKLIVVEGTEDITIKISDEGGGIKRSAIPLVWTYMYTTMEAQDVNVNFQSNDFKAPMAGFGYGLPLSRLVSRSSIPLGVRAEVDEGLVCEVLWWRPKINLDGGIWYRRLYPFEPIVEQPGAVAVVGGKGEFGACLCETVIAFCRLVPMCIVRELNRKRVEGFEIEYKILSSSTANTRF